MGKIFATLVLSFFAIFLINLIWVLTNLYYFAIDGFQNLFVATTFVENVYFSIYLKWILLLDFSYFISVLIFSGFLLNPLELILVPKFFSFPIVLELLVSCYCTFNAIPLMSVNSNCFTSSNTLGLMQASFFNIFSLVE